MTSSTTIPDAVVAKPSWRWRLVKWLVFTLLGLVSVVAVLAAALYATAKTAEKPVGFQISQLVDANGKPFPVAIWYPTRSQPSTVWLGSFFAKLATNAPVDGAATGETSTDKAQPDHQQLPLVIISHGTGGGLISHLDLAMTLASAGFVVAAPMHQDNYLDSSSVGSADYIYGRSLQLSQTIDFMLNKWPEHAKVNPQKIAAYGFSIGAFSVLTSVGANPDLAGVRSYCANHAEFACDLLKDSQSFLLADPLPNPAANFQKDTRIRAVVVAAPGLGFTLQTEAAVAGITVPVQLWHGEQDTTVPFASNSQGLLSALGDRAELHKVPAAAHYSFLVPCGVLSLLPICADPADFDRDAFHQQMNSAVLAFFQQQLSR